MIRPAIRWLLVAISPLVVWWLAIAFGILAIAVLDSFCPPEQVVSGLCVAAWHAPAMDLLMISMSALAAFGIVVIPATLAPSHRVIVAAAMFGLGAVFATSIAMEGDALVPFSGATVGGVAGLAATARRSRGRRAQPAPIAP